MSTRTTVSETLRKIAPLCTLLHSKTTTYAEPVQPCDGFEREARESVTRENVCNFFERTRGGEIKRTIANLHRWLVQSFKEVKIERELAWKSAPSLTTAF